MEAFSKPFTVKVIPDSYGFQLALDPPSARSQSGILMG